MGIFRSVRPEENVNRGSLRAVASIFGPETKIMLTDANVVIRVQCAQGRREMRRERGQRDERR